MKIWDEPKDSGGMERSERKLQYIILQNMIYIYIYTHKYKIHIQCIYRICNIHNILYNVYEKYYIYNKYNICTYIHVIMYIFSIYIHA